MLMPCQRTSNQHDLQLRAISCEMVCRPEDGPLSHHSRIRMSCLVGCLRTAILLVIECRPQQSTSRVQCNAIWQHSSVDASMVCRLPYAQAVQRPGVQIDDLVAIGAKRDAVALQLLLMILCKGWCACIFIWVLRVVKRFYAWGVCKAAGETSLVQEQYDARKCPQDMFV